MNHRPKLTVILPTYNCELYIETAVESILNQTFIDFELLIIDDASTDGTVPFLKSLNDNRIQLIEKPFNTGYTESLNQGLKLARGEYIARMDGDDISMPERFAKQIAYLETHPETILCATAYKFIGREPFFGFPENHEAIKVSLLKGNCICHPSVMMRKSMLDAYDIYYDQAKEPAEDYDMWIRLLYIGKLHILPEILIEYRVYAGQVSSTRLEKQKQIDIALRFSLLDQLKVKFNTEERNFLEKYFQNKDCIHLIELSIFKKIKIKLKNSNTVGFFDPKYFENYLADIEASVIRRFFKKYNYYSPVLYLNFLVAKFKWGLGFNSNEELKLLVKCFLLRKNS